MHTFWIPLAKSIHLNLFGQVNSPNVKFYLMPSKDAMNLLPYWIIEMQIMDGHCILYCHYLSHMYVPQCSLALASFDVPDLESLVI